MPFIIPANTLAASGFDVDNSCRFNPADSAFMHKTPNAGNRRTATFSFWTKRSLITSAQTLFWAGSDNSNYQTFPRFLASDKLVVGEVNSGSTTWEIVTDRILVDAAAWYHIVVALDTTQGTAANRVKIYVNGVQQTNLNTDGGYPGENRETLINTAVPHQIAHDYVAQYYGGYTAESILIDGQALTPTSFGETNSDSGIWIPKIITGLTFGTNGYYLKNANAGALGTDSSGNGNDFAVTGLTSVDQATDSPSNNFCTINSVATAISNAPTLSQGNLTLAASGNWRSSIGTFALTKGKWYWESKGAGSGGTILNGIASTAVIEAGGTSSGLNNNSTIGVNLPSYAYHGSSGGMYYSNTSGNGQGQAGGSWGTAYTSADLISIYLDLDNNKLYMAKNDTLQVSGVGYDIQAGYAYYPVCIPFAVTQSLNFGIGAFGATAVSSAVADANGFGAFEYDPSRGGATVFNGEAKNFLSLCTNNLNILE